MNNKLHYILSPCGTSLLTNNSDPEIRKIIVKYANAGSSDEISESDLIELKNRIKAVEEIFVNANYEQAACMSAEINGIIKFYGGNLANGANDSHLLLSTDTWLGEQTANLVKLWLANNLSGSAQIRVHRQKDLQTSDLESFQIALSDLVKMMDDEIKDWKKSGYNIIFNLTGGFKAIQGFLQSIANFYADETVYVFERSKELLRIPKLPVTINAESIVRKHLNAFRKLDNNLSVKKDELLGIPGTMLLNIGEDTELSAWGKILFRKSKNKIYGEKLLDSPEINIIYSQKFIDSVKGLSGERLEMINDKIDQLSKFMKDRKYNPKSLDFKALKGGTNKGSTHELDAWADQDAKRIFCRWNEKNQLILDRLDKGLH